MHSDETLALMEKAIHHFHANKDVFEDLDIQEEWGIIKLHIATSHYMSLITWLGTLDNFDTQYTERLHIDLTKDAYDATNHKDEYAQMTVWVERKEKILYHDQFIKWRISGKIGEYSLL